jgi:hypothetical protein
MWMWKFKEALEKHPEAQPFAVEVIMNVLDHLSDRGDLNEADNDLSIQPDRA